MPYEKKKAELLAPVGDLAMCHAAVHNGADAIYVGVPGWNARGRSADLSVDELREMIAFCRLRGVKVYFALNILIFDRELNELPDELASFIALRPDAFIVQDLGLVRLIHAIAPDQAVHASTQMTLASAEGVRLMEKLGITRCVLARELSVAHLARIHEAAPEMELEAFVHGALCVSYSGQCLTSESFGGRSANRGQCAQSCRLPYRLRVDGKEMDVSARPYLFSPQDLCSLDILPEITGAGVVSLKIEGRLKSPEYVAATCTSYRAMLDQGRVDADARTTIEALFSRGLFTGWLHGVDHQQLVDGRTSSHHGALLGTVAKRQGQSVWIKGSVDCLPGDGVCFAGKGEETLGGRVYAACREGALLRLDFAHGLDLKTVVNGSLAYRNDSPAIEKEVRRSFTEKERFRRVPVQAELSGAPGKPLSYILNDGEGHRIQVDSEDVIQVARSPRTDDSRLISEASALTATAYSCSNTVIHVNTDAFVSDKQVRILRQQAVTALDSARLALPPLAVNPGHGKELLKSALAPTTAPKEPLLTVLVRRVEQLEGLSGLPVEIMLDLDYGKDLAMALETARSLGFSVGIATLRVHKPGENYTLRAIRDLRPDRVLVRSLGALAFLQDSGLELHGDYSLNATNRLSMQWLLSQGLQSVHPSWDLDSRQLMDLARVSGGCNLEVALHQYMPTFHMEHCVFAANLSQGKCFPFCGRACEKHRVEVIDHKGESHFLESDAECRNTLFKGKPQSALRLYNELRNLGVHRFRLELLHESPAEARLKASTLLRAFEGAPVETLLRDLGAAEKYGLSDGQLFNGGEWKDRKKEARRTVAQR